MSTPDPAQIKALFGEVLDAREQGQTTIADRLLETAPGGVRDSVQRLLDAHSRASGVLLDDTQPPTHRSPDTPRPAQPTPSIAGYEIAEEIGHGGFGIVYRARQRSPIDRPVAVKILRRELVSEEGIERFRAESGLLARMSHEYIARVFDAGLTDAGQPFVAMELIDAEPLHHACDSLRLDTRGRVELMTRVCDAIQHAHQRAVIHRDLKPANILVETNAGHPRPRVIDFGIAKLLDHDPNAPHTRAQVRLGTPRYMSPEQRTGTATADTRVDVYALGAILCELLAGDVPSSAGGTTGESTITRPSKIASDLTRRAPAHPKSLRGDLDRIVLKACADDPDQRYPSAQAMGDDLRRYLDGHPVSASPPGVVYLTRKFVRRHRASVSLAGVLGVALLVAMGVAALKWREAGHERDLANANAARVAFIGDFLLEMLLLSADHNARGAPPILNEEQMQQLADRAADGLGEDPARMLPMLAGIGRFQVQSGYPELGTSSVRRALDFAIAHHGLPSEAVIDLRVRLHDLLWSHGLAGWKEQITLAEQESAELFADDDPRRLRVLQRADTSIENLQRIIALYDKLPDVDPTEHYHALFALSMHQRFGPSPSDQLETTRRLYEVARANFPAQHTAVIDSMSHYGEAMTAYAPSAEAEALLSEAYDRAMSVLGHDHFTTEAIRRALARIYGVLGRPEEGIPYARENLRAVERRVGRSSIQYANTLYELGRLYHFAGQYQNAYETLDQSLQLKAAQWSAGHEQITSTQIALAQVAHLVGEHERAEQLCLAALPHLSQRRHAITYVSAMTVRIAVRIQAQDGAGADQLRAQTRAHLSDLGFNDQQIADMLSN